MLFLVDPQWEGDWNDVPDDAVWAVSVVARIPAGRPVDGDREHPVKGHYAGMVEWALERAAAIRSAQCEVG